MELEGAEDEQMAISWAALRDILQGVQNSLFLLTEERKETNRLLDRLINVLESSG